MESDNPLLDDFVLALSWRQPARMCFVPTASGDSAPYIARFYRAFSGRATLTDLTLADQVALPHHPACAADLPAFLAGQDVIYVGGGNTAQLLATWRAHGLDVLVGVCAGMLCWFTGGVTDSFGPLDALTGGLGLIDGSGCLHYDSERERRPVFHRRVAEGFPGGWGADDGAALHFRGTELVEAVSSRPAAGAYGVDRIDDKVVERRLSRSLPRRFPSSTRSRRRRHRTGQIGRPATRKPP